MKAKVQRFHSPDVDLMNYTPDDQNDFSILLQIIAAPQGGPGEESFDLIVCTPYSLIERIDQEGPLVGRHHLIVNRWDAKDILRYLTKLVEAEEAPTWQDLAARLGRVGKWEFEDYVD